MEQGETALAGTVLIGELRCAACHQLPPHLVDKIPDAKRRGIPLSDRGAVDIEFVQSFIASPHDTKPGSLMPNVLPADSDQIALELAHYLVSLESRADDALEIEPTRVAEGDALYHSVGCVACHAPRREPSPMHSDDDPFADETQIEYPPLSIPSVPLAATGRAWSHAGLSKYLLEGKGRMPDMKLTEQEAASIATYLIAEAGGPTVNTLEIDPMLAKAGAVHYEQRGCVQCHEGGPSTPPTAVSTDLTGGCLNPASEHTGPRYALSPDQKEAIAVAWNDATSINEVSKFLFTAAANNCLACHKRGAFGGVDPGRAPYFRTTIDADLGDEGSIPPTLTGVGSKLTTEALTAVLEGDGDARPYMATRMPNFHFENATEIAEMLAKIDADPDAPATDVTGLLHHHRNHYGREMMGDEAFNCVSCHNLNGHPSTGIPAIDLALAPTRLRPEWFKKYLLDPASLRPGTRMPAYFPEGKSTYAKLFKGNASQQIEALWIYLREVDQTRLPSGMEKDDRYVIVPKDRPVVHRTFMKDVGTRAIAVGFPQGVHYAFDATRVRSVMVWRGGFLDADATWNDRFSPYIEPLSDDRWGFLPIVPFAHGDFKDPWPEVEGTEADYHFEGIRLNADHVPTMLYRFGDIDIEETVTPFDKDNGFKRSFVLTNVTTPLRYVVAVGAHVDEEGDGYRVNSDWETKLNISGAELRQVMAPNGFAALVTLITPVDGRIEFSQEVIW